MKTDLIKTPDRVKSLFRSPWYGIIISINDNDVATVLVLFDRHGNPMRHALKKQLHIHWLRFLGKKKQPSKYAAGLYEDVPDFMQDDELMRRMWSEGLQLSSRFKWEPK